MIKPLIDSMPLSIILIVRTISVVVFVTLVFVGSVVIALIISSRVVDFFVRHLDVVLIVSTPIVR